MLKVVKVRIYPNSSQKLALAKAFGICRWLWNYFLNLMNETYKETGKGLSGYDVKKLIPDLKKQEETTWLSETYSQCLQQVCLNLGVAFNNFFEKRAQYPNFKCKHGKQSLQYPANIKIENDCLNVPKIGLIYTKFHSSKTCHVCLNKVGTLPLDVRHWTCKNCGTKHDRDINAAINIRDEAMRIIQTSGTGDKACRQTVRRGKGGRKKSTTTLVLGQEANTLPSGQCGSFTVL